MAQCKTCGSKNVYGLSRVVGYFSMIENWNEGKQAEHKDRQNGDYQIGKTIKLASPITIKVA